VVRDFRGWKPPPEEKEEKARRRDELEMRSAPNRSAAASRQLSLHSVLLGTSKVARPARSQNREDRGFTRNVSREDLADRDARHLGVVGQPCFWQFVGTGRAQVGRLCPTGK